MNKYFITLANIATHNKYYTWYLNICQSSKARALRKGQGILLEKHHIIPRSFNLGGEKDLDNIVMLTPREHYISHMLLARMCFNSLIYKKKMLYAVWRLSNRGVLYIPTSRKYEFAKKEMIKLIKLRVDPIETRMKKSNVGKKNGMYGKTHTNEVKQKLAILRREELTGKTYEELYGEDRAQQLKNDKSNKLKDYIKNNPGIRSGSNNGRAKSTIVTSPDGIEYHIHGTLKSFCEDHNLSLGVLKNTLYTGKESKGRNLGWKIRWK